MKQMPDKHKLHHSSCYVRNYVYGGCGRDPPTDVSINHICDPKSPHVCVCDYRKCKCNKYHDNCLYIHDYNNVFNLQLLTLFMIFNVKLFNDYPDLIYFCHGNNQDAIFNQISNWLLENSIRFYMYKINNNIIRITLNPILLSTKRGPIIYAIDNNTSCTKVGQGQTYSLTNILYALSKTL